MQKLVWSNMENISKHLRWISKRSRIVIQVAIERRTYEREQHNASDSAPSEPLASEHEHKDYGTDDVQLHVHWQVPGLGQTLKTKDEELYYNANTVKDIN